MSQHAKGPSKPRDPPPTLFHRPSPTASHASIPSLTPGTSGAAAQPSSFASPSSMVVPPLATATTGADTLWPGTNGGPGGGGLNIHLPLPRRESTRAATERTDRTDALWAEMQATLEAVELSASGGAAAAVGAGARVFGPDHERKLDELRAAQIALAQAWARSEADEAIETVGASAGGGAGEGAASEGGVGRSEGAAGVSVGAGGGTDGGLGGRSTAGTASARPGSSGLGLGAMGAQAKPGEDTGEETEVDILLARKRREANDRYFQRVNQGVLDVVAKLEDVAIAMRAVEQESKELWSGENESAPASAKG